MTDEEPRTLSGRGRGAKARSRMAARRTLRLRMARSVIRSAARLSATHSHRS